MNLIHEGKGGAAAPPKFDFLLSDEHPPLSFPLQRIQVLIKLGFVRSQPRILSKGSIPFMDARPILHCPLRPRKRLPT
ncbi:MAG: hypothetical protein RLZZ165_1273 [Bacteroidota bacterium]